MDRVAEALQSDSDLKLDWLENFSVVEFENALVLSYFVRAVGSPLQYIIRVSLVPPSPDGEVSLPSVCHAWPMALLFELEAEEMFGVRFLNRRNVPNAFIAGRLPQGWKGYPLRKKYEFPKEVSGIVHSRPFAKVGTGIKTTKRSDS
jgi:NADH:ubiquinone oxidoreductase subunit C